MLRGDTALYGGAIVLDRLLALLLLPLLTRAIGAADYGAWTQTLVGAGLLLPVVLFAFPTTIVRSFAAATQAAARPAGFARLGVFALVLLLVASLLLWAASEPVARLVWGDGARAALVPALALVLAGDAGFEFANAWLRAAGRIGWISAGLLLRSVMRYMVVWWLAAGGDVPLAGWLPTYALTQAALALALLAAGLALLRVEARAFTAVPPPAPALRGLLAFSTPLVALALLTALNGSIDRFLLVRTLGLDTVAIYAAAVSLCSVIAALYSVLGFTLFPVLARHWEAGRRDEVLRLTQRVLRGFVALAVPLALGMTLAGPALLRWLATPAFDAPWPVFAGQSAAILAFGAYQILLYPLLLGGRSARVLLFAVTAALLNATLNLALVPALGMSGAAAAAALANAVMLVWAATLAARTLGCRPAALLGAATAGHD